MSANLETRIFFPSVQEARDKMTTAIRLGLIGNIARKEFNPAAYPFSLDSDFELLLSIIIKQDKYFTEEHTWSKIWQLLNRNSDTALSELQRNFINCMYRKAAFLASVRDWSSDL